MKINLNHPSFITFLDQITENILSNISIENYFSLPQEKKLNVQYIVFKLFKNAVKYRATFTDNEIKILISLLCKKNEENENYEFASILNDIKNNFDGINEFTKPKRKTNKKIKTENDE